MEHSNARRRARLALAGAIAVVAVAVSLRHVTAADHRDSPLLSADPSADIADVYSFISPTDPDALVLVMTVSGLIPPSEAFSTFFDPAVLYQFKIDRTGDAVEELVIYAHANGTGPGQTMRFIGPVAPNRPGTATDGIPLRGNYIGRVAVSGATPVVATFRGIKLFAGVRDDPFYFDLTQFQAIIGGQATGFRNPGVDTFAGSNVLAIAVELPMSLLGDARQLRVWGTTSR
ncbi:MAG: DUF4331 family protein [Longimicrobiales bacterium]